MSVSDSGEEIERLKPNIFKFCHTPIPTVRNTPALEDKFSHAFNDKDTCDITVKVGAKVFHAHRLVLSAWSSVLRENIDDLTDSLFNVDKTQLPELKLSQDGGVINVFDEFLSFFYSGKILLNKENVWQIIDLSQRYGVTELQDACNNFLMDSLKLIKSRAEATKFVKLSREKALDNVHRCSQKRLQFILRSYEIPSLTLKLDTFHDHFSKLYDDESSSDVTIKLEDDLIYLHSPIVCCQSMVLGKIVKEAGHTRPIVLPDMYDRYNIIWRDVFKFFYTEKIDLNHENVWPILEFGRCIECETLLELCFDFLLNMPFTLDIGGNLIMCFKQAENLNKEDIRKHFFEMILANFFIFSDDLIPNMSNNLLCKVMESSDLVVNCESQLYHDLGPKLQLLRNCDTEFYQTLLTKIRFNHMTAKDLNDIMDNDNIEYDMKQEFLQKAMLYRCLMWEKAGVQVSPELRPRLYLDPPGPIFKTDKHRGLLRVIEVDETFKTAFTFWKRSFGERVIQKDLKGFCILKQRREGDSFVIEKCRGSLNIKWSMQDNILRTILQFQAKKCLEELTAERFKCVAARAVLLVSSDDYYEGCTMKTFQLQECTKGTSKVLYSKNPIQFGTFWNYGYEDDANLEIRLYLFVR